MKLAFLLISGLAAGSLGSGAPATEPSKSQNLLSPNLFRLSLQPELVVPTTLPTSALGSIGQLVINESATTIDERPVVSQPLSRPSGDLIDDRR